MTKPVILILAAGEGTRMKSALPKVLHEAAGDSLLGHVARAASPLGGEIGIVIGRGADLVRERFAGRKFFVQKKRLGSGHAVMAAASWLRRQKGDVAVLCGDAPMIRTETLRELVRVHRAEKNSATILTAKVPDPSGYGRIIRGGSQDRPVAIVEEREADVYQKAVNEINSGTYCFRAADLMQALSKVRPNNSKGEYYVTDVIGLLVEQGRPVGALCIEGEEEVLGVNHRGELADADRILRGRVLRQLMLNGVSVIDPASTYVDAGVKVGPDTVIFPQSFLRRGTVVGSRGRIGPFAFLEDCRLGDDVEVRAAFAYGAIIGNGAKVGPYAHLRPGTKVAPGARIGNFVETKNATVGRGSKVSHLSYVGDAVLGDDVNIGAGVITCNYDGFQKHKTLIGSGAFVGSNANLVAPVRIGKGAVVGAGSTIGADVPADSLGLERAQLVIKKGWAAKRRKELAKRGKVRH